MKRRYYEMPGASGAASGYSTRSSGTTPML